VDKVIAGMIPTGNDQYRFDATVLEEVLKRLIEEKLHDPNACMADRDSSDFNPCPTFVVAASTANAEGPPVLFRSYNCEGHNADKCAIWQAARCTSATPSFFKPMFVDVRIPGGWYIDGGLGHNNPSQLALDEARRIWPTVKRFCLVSIGTGRQKNVEFVDIKDSDTPGESKSPLTSALSWMPGGDVVRTVMNTSAAMMELKKIAKACFDMSISSEPVHQSIFKSANSPDPDLRFPYHRFNVEKGTESIDLQEWKAKVRIGELTTQYMREGEGELKRNNCVNDIWRPAAVECNWAQVYEILNCQLSNPSIMMNDVPLKKNLSFLINEIQNLLGDRDYYNS
jgi:Patatin-like phospholipase